MLLTNYNYQPCSFHFPCCSPFGNKTWLSENIMPARLVGQSIHGYTMMKASSLHEGGKEEHFDYQWVCIKGFYIYTGFSNWKDAKVA